jgi:hypothetical protein
VAKEGKVSPIGAKVHPNKNASHLATAGPKRVGAPMRFARGHVGPHVPSATNFCGESAGFCPGDSSDEVVRTAVLSHARDDPGREVTLKGGAFGKSAAYRSAKALLYENVASRWRIGWPCDLPKITAATYAGLYVSWALLAGLGSGRCRDTELSLAPLLNRQLTPGRFCFETLEGIFNDTVLNEEGNLFTTVYFDSHFRTYSETTSL